jgi:ubiquinone biosynthesis protein COQ4
MVATLGETTGACALRTMRDHMLRSAEGRDVLQERPMVTQETVNAEKVCN